MGRSVKKGKGRGINPAWLLLFCGIAIIAVAGARLWTMFDEDERSRQSYAEVRVAASPNIKEGETPPSAKNFASLRLINGDVVAWVFIPDTQIDYPIVQGIDNEEYLHKGFDGQERKAGTLFLDVQASPDFEGLNHPVYGHNMKDGSMFGELKLFLKEEFALAHTEMYLYTPAGDWRLIPFAIYIAPNSGNYHTEPEDQEDAYMRARDWIEKSRVAFDVEVQPEDRFVTLVTCYSDDYDRRVVLHAILVENEK